MGCSSAKVVPQKVAWFGKFQEMGGNKGAMEMIEIYYSRPKGKRIEKCEERAMTLEELKSLKDTIKKGCYDDDWTDPFTGQELVPADVSLYHLNFQHISPATVPEGVILKGLQKRQYKSGDKVVQTDSGSRMKEIAVGFVKKPGQSSDVTVIVTQGRFICKLGEGSDSRKITVDGEDVGEPSMVVYPNSVSYKELINPTPLVAKWFTSHWWGEPVLHFISCCEHHAKMRKLDSEASYWVCAYANRQHDLSAEIAEDPDQTSFRRAMRLAQGVLLILDETAMPFKRIWCCFELHRTIMEDGKLVDIATHSGKGAEMLSDGPLPDEEAYTKRRREISFPIQLLAEGLRCRLEEGQSSMSIDRVRILNCMAKNKAQLNDASVVDRITTTKDQARYDVANDILHARFALAAWPQAIKRGLVEDFDKSKPKSLNLPKILSKHKQQKEVKLDLRNFEELNDLGLRSLADGLPADCEVLELYIGSCPNVSDAGLKWLLQRLPYDLRRLVLYCAQCEKVTDESSSIMKTSKLPPNVSELKLIFNKCSKVTDATLSNVARCFPDKLKDLSLGFRSCPEVTDLGLDVLGDNLPRTLEKLDLQLQGCSSITVPGFRSFVKKLPPCLKQIEEMNLRGTGVGREISTLDELKKWAAEV